MKTELLEFLMHNKKWWLIPPVIVFIVFGVLIAVSSTSAVSPFIYMLF